MALTSETNLIVLIGLVFMAIKVNGGEQNHQQRRKSVPYLSPTWSSQSLPERPKPNIVLILTDDQDVELGSLNYMNRTLKHLRHVGAEFRHAYVTTPMCCPSRSSLLTGMYVHNHQVFTNNDNCSSAQWQATHETRSFATYLSNAGYRTGYFGKYLNKYNGSYIPPGWREWGGLIMNSKYYNYSINMNGKKIKHGFDYHKDYYPDLIVNDSIAFLRQSKKNNAHKPVMLTMSFPAPHGPEDSAPQFSNMFFNITSHHIPSYDYAPNPDKQWILQVTKKMQPIHKEFTDLLMTKRLQTLQSVDIAVERVVQELKNLGELDNTYIIYTSDHGYHLGQFGLIKGKSFPFEFDVRVPFLVRGPGVEPGSVVDDIVLNIDLAPTFLDMAGVEPPSHMDGRSVLPLIRNTKRRRVKWPDTFLIESSGRRETPFLDAKLKLFKTSTPSVTTESIMLSTVKMMGTKQDNEFNNSTTAGPKHYDSSEIDDEEDGDETDDDLANDNTEARVQELVIKRDVEELTNKDRIPMNGQPYFDLPMDNRLLPAVAPITTKLERLAIECVQPNMQTPCSPGQKWFCEKENGRWRKHKCKLIALSTLSKSRTYKKCACFTPDGPIYKKIPIDNVNKRYRLRSRNKRNFKGSKNLQHTKVSSRQKRETMSKLETAMEDVRGQILVLQNTNVSQTETDDELTNLETNKISDTKSGCAIIGHGKVNCTNQIYQDRKTWQKSRHTVDNEIQKLKGKLEQLKEIRRHLKHFRPSVAELFLNQNETVNGGKNRSQWIDLDDPSLEIPDVLLPMPKVNKNKKRKRIQVVDGDEIPTKRPRLRPDVDRNTTDRITVETSTIHHRHDHGLNSRRNKSNATSPKVNKLPIDRQSTDQEGDLIPYPTSLENCQCETVDETEQTEREHQIAERRRLKEEKLRRKLRRQKKKEQLESQCLSERMNCFQHDNDHWKTEPKWTKGPFCFCMNANNNTYSCVRTINATHNILYCEFTTGLVTFYNLRIDPFELENRIDQLRPEDKAFYHQQLKDLVACKGRSCTVNYAGNFKRHNVLGANPNTTHNRYKKRKMSLDGTRSGLVLEEKQTKTDTRETRNKNQTSTGSSNSKKRRKQKVLNVQETSS